MLAMIFAEHIMKSLRTYDDVPELLKPQVKQILIDNNLEHLAK